MLAQGLLDFQYEADSSSHGLTFARSLDVELVKAESLRAMRERPNNPDAVDLGMRGRALMTQMPSDPNGTALSEAITLFERALALDAGNMRAMTGLTDALVTRVGLQASKNPAGDLERAEKTIDAALALEPENASAHVLKGWVYFEKGQWAPATTEEETAIAYDSNDADAYAATGFLKMLFIGHSEDGLAGIETAIRLSPRDTDLPDWQTWMCYLQAHLTQWDQTIEWCNKAIAASPQDLGLVRRSRRRLCLARARCRGESRSRRPAQAEAELHRADMGRHAFGLSRPDLQSPRRARHRRPAQGGGIRGRREEQLSPLSFATFVVNSSTTRDGRRRGRRRPSSRAEPHCARPSSSG